MRGVDNRTLVARIAWLAAEHEMSNVNTSRGNSTTLKTQYSQGPWVSCLGFLRLSGSERERRVRDTGPRALTPDQSHSPHSHTHTRTHALTQTSAHTRTHTHARTYTHAREARGAPTWSSRRPPVRLGRASRPRARSPARRSQSRSAHARSATGGCALPKGRGA